MANQDFNITDAELQSNKPGISILYVDDEPDLLELGKMCLEQSPEFRVDTLPSAEDALSSPGIFSYDAIVSDYQMPKMNGIAFLKAVREKSRDIPFILFTGRGREEVVIDAINNGADFYLQKGGDIEAQFAELSHKIRQAVKRKQYEDRLQLLKTSVDQAYDEVFWLDFEGNILYVNESASRKTGFSREELQAMKIFSLDPDFPPEVWAASVEDLRQRKKQFIITRHRCKDGSIIDVEILTSYVRKNDREYSFAFVREISNRRQEEAAIVKNRDYLDQILSSVQAGIMVIDSADHTIIDINPYAAALIGLEKELITGKICHTFICPGEEEQSLVSDLHNGSNTAEWYLISSDKGKIPIIITVTPITLDARDCMLESFIKSPR
jgi:PAS domain S-box-containing protein